MIPTFRPQLGDEELQAINGVFQSRWLGMGEMTRQFEQRLAEYLDVPHVIAVAHGTAALHLALDALDLRPGDEVIVPSLTFVATVQAIRLAGAVPMFCEVDPKTLNLDIDDACQRVTSRTRAIVPVHFAGLPCEMDRLLREMSARGIRVVEDAAHAFGASYRGRKIGTFGDATCFSFDSIKHITCGEGGAIATSDPGLARRVACCRRLGMDHSLPDGGCAEQNWQYRVVSHGFRYHMSDINAAIGLAQLEKLPAFLERKRRIVERYDDAFTGQADLEPVKRDPDDACPWAYVVKVPGGQRDAFREHLRCRGVATLIQFIPNHLQPAFATFRLKLPVTEGLFEEILSLPLFVEMSDADTDIVIDAVRSFFGVPARQAVAC